MYEINRTYARTIFKDLLGQANHFLITILVGLGGVRSGTVVVDPEFRTSWNPKSVVGSADRSRFFAIDLALIRAVDSLDTYMMRSRRRPLAISATEFAGAMDGTGQKISKRLEVFDRHLDKLPKHVLSFAKLAIDWRNRRVHSLARENLEEEDINNLLSEPQFFKESFSGLIISELVKDYKSGQSPTFKDVAAIIRLMHMLVEHYDSCLLQQLDVEEYVRSLMFISIFNELEKISEAELMISCNKIWGGREKRSDRIRRVIRLSGISEVDTLSGRQVPEELIEKILDLDVKASANYLRPRSS